MFDTYEQVTKEVTKNVNITENKAPTDQSIELLKEMQEKAFQSIISRYHVKTNIIEGVVTYIESSWRANMGLQCIYQFQLNGVDFQVEETIDRYDIALEEPKELVRKLYNVISSKIAEELTGKTLENGTFIRNVTQNQYSN